MKKYLCFRCGEELYYEDTLVGSELGLISEDKSFTEEDIDVVLMSCEHCGMHYEIYDIPESEQENYPYFNSNKEKK